MGGVGEERRLVRRLWQTLNWLIDRRLRQTPYSLLLRDLGPGVAQGDDSVPDLAVGGWVGVEREIAEALELVALGLARMILSSRDLEDTIAFMNANTKSRGSLARWSVVVLATLLVGALPGGAIAGSSIAPQQTAKQTRKVYYVFTAGSAIPVPYEQIAGHVATTASHVQVVRINDRNRTQPVEFWLAGHKF